MYHKDLFWDRFFLVYINDLPGSCEKAEVAMFADDTTLNKSGKKFDPLLSQEIGIVSHQTK